MQITTERGLSLTGTLYKKNVKEPTALMLKPGRKNAKLGHRVTVKAWQNKIIYQLSLEERASCPTNCKQWSNCYGNNMPFAHRFNHQNPDFLPLLHEQLRYLSLKHRKHDGFVVRLHVLGDFYSVDYVNFWANQLTVCEGLHVFGYTHHQPTTDIGQRITELNQLFPDQFRIRFSDSDHRFSANVVADDYQPTKTQLFCPQQRGSTATCATCGLCWAQEERSILFLRH